MTETTAGVPFVVISFTDLPDVDGAGGVDAVRSQLREGDVVIVWHGQVVAAVATDVDGRRAVLDRLATNPLLAAAGMAVAEGGDPPASGDGLVDLVTRGRIDLRSRPERERLGARVLIVDDEDPIRSLLRGLLSAEGFAVVESPSARDALADFSLQRPDIIVTDNNMPGMTGMELAEALRKHGEDVPIVLFTAALTSEIADEAEALGVRVVAKTVPAELVDELRSLVDLR